MGESDEQKREAELRAIAEMMRGLALEAGAEVMKWHGARTLDVASKADETPVTQADRAANGMILSGLRRGRPDIAVISEEAEPVGAPAKGGRFFLVDPLDGTKEFIAGRDEFTVNIALIEAGAPVLGVVFAPAKQRLYWTPDPDFAVEERGAIGPEIGDTTRLWVAEADNEALRVVASRSHRDAATDAFIERFSVAALIGAGSSLKLCEVAAGRADLYPRLGRTMAWDIAAGHAVLRAAGGAARRLTPEGRLGDPLGYDPSRLENGAFVAFAPSVVFPKEMRGG